MASSVALQARKTSDSKQSYVNPNTLLERVEQLVKSYEGGQSNPLDISAQVDPLIEELFNLKEKDLPLAREGLCRLLKLDVEKVQLELTRRLKSLFSLSLLSYDVRNNQSKQLVDLEKQISGTLALHVRSTSSEVLFGLIDIYQDVLERFWLLPHLVEDRGSYVIIEENIQRMRSDADRWLLPLLNDSTQSEKIKMALKNQPRIFQRIIGCPSAIVDEIKQLKSALGSNSTPAVEGSICENLGNVYQSLGAYSKAIEHFERALQVAQKLGDRAGERRANGNLGNTYRFLGESRKAIEHHEKCLQMAKELNDRREEGRAYGNLGNAHRSLGEYRKAIEYNEKALQMAQELGDRTGEGTANGNLGITYDAIGEYPKAMEFSEKALWIAQAQGDRRGEGAAYAGLGITSQSLGKYNKAVEYHEKALQIAQAIGDRRGEGMGYGNLGIAYDCLGDYPKAIEFYEKDLQIAQELGDRWGEGMAYGNLGNAYVALGDCRKAIEFYKKTLQIAQSLGDQAREGMVYGNLGHAHQSLGEFRIAIEFYEKDLQIARELGDRGEEGRAYGSLGNGYQSLGEYRKAIEYHEKNLQIARELGGRAEEKGANRNLGIAYRALGEYRKAIEYHEKHLQMSQELGDRQGEGRAYGSLGVAYRGLGEYRKAIEFYEKGLRMAQELGDRTEERTAYGHLGNAHRSLGDHRKAIDYHEKALQMSQELGDRGEEGWAFNNLGYAHRDLNNLPQAEKHFRQSIAVFSSLQHELGDKHRWKITIFEELVEAYLGLESVLLKQKKIREALEVSNARRARALYEVLAKRKSLQQADAFMNVDTILRFVTATKSTYLFYSFCAPSEEEKVHLSVYVITASGEIHFEELSLNVLLEDAREVSKIVSRFPFGRTKGEEEPSAAVPIIAAMGECFATKGKNDPIPPALINRFKDRLKKWHEVFIKPIEQYLPKEKSSPLVIIPDGFLSQIPFAAFRDDKDQYLIERFSLSFAPSLSALTLLNSPPSASPGQACIVSNPATPDSNLSLEVSESHVPQLNSLLKAPTEALFTNKKATIEGFRQVASRARLIHIACHGEAGIEKNPDKFSIFEGLLKFAPDESHRDGYLHAEEVASFPLIADLVFLDACFSGTGKVQREGSIGPIWSFHAAGASSVIGGLWFVPESKLIIDLIDNFYTHYLSQSMSKSKALHLAITKAIEQERESPHLWGPLFLSGAN